MPLHLLSKKSWNVYNPASIARVRADEAAAAAREEAHDQQLQEYEAAKRLALLRGEEPPAPPSLEQHAAELGGQHGEKRGADPAREERRKRRKLAGEDDTDRDIRVARLHEEERKARRDEVFTGGGRDARRDDVPLVDHAGHIQLFAPPSTREIRKQKEAEGQGPGKEGRKDEQGDDVGALRFADAAGFKKRPDSKPWYASGFTGTEEVDLKGGRDYGDSEGAIGRDAFGNEDAGRGRRDAARLSAADPMAAMKNAQSKIREVEKSREASRRERERELEELKEMQRKEARRERKRRERGRERRHSERQYDDDEESLEGFNLDTSRNARELHRDSSRQHGRRHDSHWRHSGDRDRRNDHRYEHDGRSHRSNEKRRDHSYSREHRRDSRTKD